MSEPSVLPPPTLEQLRFQYQPVAPLYGAGVGWHEALVRWHLPDGTIRGPLDILPYWLSPYRQPLFTRFTVDQAASQLRDDANARLSINLSPRQVTHPSALRALEALLPAARQRLIVELTEQDYRDLGALWSSLAAMAERCDVVLLDDVSLDDLARRLRADAPVDGIKLDRSVLLALLEPDRRQETSDLISEAAERYRIVVAEGVEDPRHLGLLDGLGVTHVQGFGIGRPAAHPGEAPTAALPRHRPAPPIAPPDLRGDPTDSPTHH